MTSRTKSLRARLLGSTALTSIGTVASLLLIAPAYAAGTDMPWETPLNTILESVQGPVAKIMSVIIITVTGLSLAC